MAAFAVRILAIATDKAGAPKLIQPNGLAAVGGVLCWRARSSSPSAWLFHHYITGDLFVASCSLQQFL